MNTNKWWSTVDQNKLDFDLAALDLQGIIDAFMVLGISKDTLQRIVTEIPSTRWETILKNEFGLAGKDFHVANCSLSAYIKLKST